ncbi:hypothetical protein OESDEN_24661 [Oesophagostomum dentatum]|uniref:Uncharacterized protein n=1 Tax=Oesophagostomum dentatum TaxID=61180 RepID=A0A0B1RRQ2_OESDE|nr:hypothetical protein OESDEN_24661 [Oesophagostomum dentatum]
MEVHSGTAGADETQGPLRPGMMRIIRTVSSAARIQSGAKIVTVSNTPHYYSGGTRFIVADRAKASRTVHASYSSSALNAGEKREGSSDGKISDTKVRKFQPISKKSSNSFQVNSLSLYFGKKLTKRKKSFKKLTIRSSEFSFIIFFRWLCAWYCDGESCRFLSLASSDLAVGVVFLSINSTVSNKVLAKKLQWELEVFEAVVNMNYIELDMYLSS